MTSSTTGSTARPTPPDDRPGSVSTGLWALVGLLLLPPAIVPLLVGIYDRTDPTLLGFPFYYWFQFALIPVAALFTVAAYFVATVAFRRDRQARGISTPAERAAEGR